MSDQHNGRGDSELREQVAYICDQFDRIHSDLETHSAQGIAPLERVEAALQAGEDPAPPLDTLHEALLAAGDAIGVRGRQRSLNPIGVNPAMPEESVLLCPTDQCSRHAWPDTPEPPRCRISGEPLRKEEL